MATYKKLSADLRPFYHYSSQVKYLSKLPLYGNLIISLNTVSTMFSTFEKNSPSFIESILNCPSCTKSDLTPNILPIPNEWFVPIENDYPALEKEYLGLELHKMAINEAKTEAFESIRTRWLPD